MVVFHAGDVGAEQTCSALDVTLRELLGHSNLPDAVSDKQIPSPVCSTRLDDNAKTV